ncbi:MAG: hypothetical protein HY827_10700 [Actinobacteria bacterium]|nr:hypothetical protein [Actinomycetota bacterium]
MLLLTFKDRVLTATIVALVASIVFAAAAVASTSQFTVMEDSAHIVNPDPATQDASLDEIAALGAEAVKIPVSWRAVAPTTESGDLGNPAAYPAGTWDVVDRAVAGAKSRGLQVWLMVASPAPDWAVSRSTPKYPGVYKPDPVKFGKFAEAVGRRYSTAEFVSIWNEPDLSRYIQPQYKGGVAVGAVHYRKMYRAAYDGLMRAGRGDVKVLFGELKPRATRNDSTTVMPLLWLRDFFCIDKDGRKLTGSAAKKRECAGFKPIKAAGLAYHPYAMSGGPMVRDPLKDNATIAYLKRIERVLDQASKRHRLRGRKLKIYNSEFGFETDPPDVYKTHIELVPNFLNISEYLNYKDPRVASYSQYLLRDDVAMSAFNCGLRFADGSKKPGVYEAFQLPFNVFKAGGSNLTFWGALRMSDGSPQQAVIQAKDGSSWTTVATVDVNSSLGYFEKTVSVPGGTSKTFRLSWKTLVSREAKPAKAIKALTD